MADWKASQYGGLEWRGVPPCFLPSSLMLTKSVGQNGGREGVCVVWRPGTKMVAGVVWSVGCSYDVGLKSRLN